jgi:membrane fusion protein, type I secretion system
MSYSNQFSLDIRNLLNSTGLILLISFIILSGWSSLAPISSATLAPGHIRAEGNRQTIQHHDRGVVDKVMVDNGDQVEQGQTLITLDTREILAIKKSVMEELLVTSLEIQRNKSIISQSEALLFSDDIIKLSKTLNKQAAINIAHQTWQAQRQDLNNQQNMLRLQQQQAQQQIAGKNKESRDIKKQLKLLNSDVNAFTSLSEKDFVSKSQRNKVRSNAIILERMINTTSSEINQLQTHIMELAQQSERLQHIHILTAVDDYRRLLKQASRLQKELALTNSRLDRTHIRAPISGRISQLRINAVGSTIEPEMVLMEIIPDEADLIVEARVKPDDIDSITQQNTAQIRLSAYNPRHTPLIDANIISLSPDTLADERGLRYYTLALAIDEQDIANNPQLGLYPGMPAEAIIHTGTRTLLDYLLGGLRTFSERSLREGTL